MQKKTIAPPPKPTVELGVLVPYPEEGREAKDQRRPSALRKQRHKLEQCIRLKILLFVFDVLLCLSSLWPSTIGQNSTLLHSSQPAAS